MNAAAKSTRAWEPVTPRGVAAFARAGLGRLLLVQCLVALLATTTIVWFVGDNYFPVIGTAIQNLPASGEIFSGRLDWLGPSPDLLAEGRFLSLDVDLDHSGQISPVSDLQIEFGRQTVRIVSLLGYMDWPYPGRYVIAFNRNGLEPVWGAWAAAFLIVAGGAAVIGLLLSWWLLSALYCLPVWLLGFFTNRDLNFRQSWRLSGAALMPGALLMTAAIVFYGLGLWNLVSFGFAFGAHLIVGWIYLFLSLLFVPRASDRAKTKRGNPFKKKGNPFK